MKPNGTRELPIIFTAESVRAILENRKSQTRRIVTPEVPEGCWLESVDSGRFQCFRIRPDALNPEKPQWSGQNDIDLGLGWRKPRFRVGDTLWAKETWGLRRHFDVTDWFRGSLEGMSRDDVLTDWSLAFRADWGPNQEACFWRSPLYMPRWASRISLEVTEVRAQRVQEISEEDALAEGVEKSSAGSSWIYRWPGSRAYSSPILAYGDGWDRINGRRSPWSRNDFVFAHTFRRKA